MTATEKPKKKSEKTPAEPVTPANAWLHYDDLTLVEKEAQNAKLDAEKDGPGGENNEYSIYDYEFSRVGDKVWRRLRTNLVNLPKKESKKRPAKFPVSKITPRHQEVPQAESDQSFDPGLRLELIDFSPLNPRKHFDTKKHEDLTASMRQHGFTISALTVRPKGFGAKAEPMHPDNEEGKWAVVHPETRAWFLMNLEKEEAQTLAATDYHQLYELVAGECRLRAARSAGIQKAPAFIRVRTDAEVLEIMMIENIQRSDLTPVEEGEGYAAMLALRDAAGQPLYTIASLAAKLGKDPRDISRGVRRCRLEGDAREWAADGRLPLRVADLLAGIPDATARAEAALEVMHPKFKKEVLTVDETQALIAEKYYRSLRGVRWDVTDFALVDPILDEQGVRVGGGACEDCPMNSVNLPGADTAAKKGAMCLNVACWKLKDSIAYNLWSQKQAARGLAAVPFEKLSEVLAQGEKAVSYEFVNLAAAPAPYEVTNGVEVTETWGEIVGTMEVPKQVLLLPNGEEIIFAKRDLVKTAAAMASPDLFQAPRPAMRRMTDEEHAAESLAALRTNKLEKHQRNALRKKLIEVVLERQGSAPAEIWTVLLGAEDSDLPDVEADVAVGYGLIFGENDDLSDAAASWQKTATPAQCMAAFLDIAAFEYYDNKFDQVALLSAFGLSSDAIKEVATAEFEAAEKEAAKKKQKVNTGVGGLSWTERPAEFEWNEHSVCINPQQCIVFSTKQAQIEISLAEDNGRFYFGYDFRHKQGSHEGSGGPASRTHPGFLLREEAIEAVLLDAAWFCQRAKLPQVAEQLKALPEANFTSSV